MSRAFLITRRTVNPIHRWLIPCDSFSARTKREGEKVLEAPADALQSTAVDDLVDKRVKLAAAAMITRRDGLLSANQSDDFKVAFKR